MQLAQAKSNPFERKQKILVKSLEICRKKECIKNLRFCIELGGTDSNRVYIFKPPIYA